MLYTTNLNLGKPEASDTVNPNSRSAFNTNADTIDSAIGDLDSLETTEQTSLVGAINELAEDYIVAQGTSGIWTYRKWNSGIAECWGITTASATNYNSARVFNYSGDNLINLPFSFINTTYCAFANVLEGNSANNNIAVATSTTSDILVTLSWNSSQTDINICINVIGMWK